MAEEQAKKVPKSDEEKKVIEKKKALRDLREQVSALREKSKALSVERQDLTERYQALAAEMGVPPLKSKSTRAPSQ